MFNKIKYIFSEEKRIFFYLLFLLLFFISILEALSIASIFPILNLLISKNGTSITFIDNIFFPNNNNDNNSIIIFCSVICSIFIIKNIILLIFNWLRIKYTQNISRNLQQKLLRNYLHIPIKEFLNTNSSLVLRNVNGEPKILLKTMVHPFFILLQELMVSIGILILLIISFSEIAVYFLVFALIFIFPFYIYTKKKLKKLSEKRLILVGRTLTFLRESIELIRDIKIYQKVSFFIDRYVKSTNKLNFVNLNIGIIGLLPRLVIEIIIVIIGLAVLFVSVFIFNIEMMNIIPSLGLMGAAFLKLIPSTIRILGQYQKIEYSKPSVNLIEKILKKSESFVKEAGISGNFEKFQNVTLQDVSHNYGSNFVLENINLKITKGDLIVIKGESGNGKTTLLNIISGLIRPTSGNVIFNDKKYLYNRSVLTNLAYVGAENYFIDASILENITLKNHNEISNAEIIKIKELMKDVNLENFVDFLDTSIGEKGSNLSEGQKQRIAIARALFNNPSLLIFDEATNSVDIENEKIILKNISINFPDLTIIFVSHRDLKINQNHRLFDLKNKKIYEKNSK